MNRINMNQNTKQPLFAHFSLLGAATFWGLMAPLGKDAMNNGINGVALVSYTLLACFFICSERECMPKRHFSFYVSCYLGINL